MKLFWLNITGMSVAIGLGLFGRHGLRIDYPLAWLFWIPGWLMMPSAFIIRKIFAHCSKCDATYQIREGSLVLKEKPE